MPHSNDPSPRLSWGHINLNVTDLDASIGFYRKLGFRIFLPGIPYLNLSMDAPDSRLPDTAADALGLPAGTSGRGCIMGLGDGFPKLDLTEWRGLRGKAPNQNADQGLVRICLASTNLQADYARLREQGVDFLSAPVPAEGGKADIAVCADPDGTLIELIEVHLENW